MKSNYNARDQIKLVLQRFLNPLVELCIFMGLKPNHITSLGFVLNVFVAVWFILGAERGERMDLSYVGWGGFFILTAGIFDMLDGQLARKTGSSSKFGALYDSVLDRYSELVMFLGICYYLVSYHYFLSSLFAFIAMIGSMMVSYIRARAEGLGISCSDGLMQRPERIITLGLSGILCGLMSYFFGDFYWHIQGIPFHIFETISFFTLPIAALAIMANYTAYTRLMHCKRTLDS
ncbi:MAG: CDP-alcohol phosphatidyltransferase family protein [Saprospiraceae bacterium]|nr:CDP-alcohol phosphatidyltransferase family protein [Saprospiraceae bacterium]